MRAEDLENYGGQNEEFAEDIINFHLSDAISSLSKITGVRFGPEDWSECKKNFKEWLDKSKDELFFPKLDRVAKGIVRFYILLLDEKKAVRLRPEVKEELIRDLIAANVFVGTKIERFFSHSKEVDQVLVDKTVDSVRARFDRGEFPLRALATVARIKGRAAVAKKGESESPHAPELEPVSEKLVGFYLEKAVQLLKAETGIELDKAHVDRIASSVNRDKVGQKKNFFSYFVALVRGKVLDEIENGSFQVTPEQKINLVQLIVRFNFINGMISIMSRGVGEVDFTMDDVRSSVEKIVQRVGASSVKRIRGYGIVSGKNFVRDLLQKREARPRVLAARAAKEEAKAAEVSGFESAKNEFVEIRDRLLRDGKEVRGEMVTLTNNERLYLELVYETIFNNKQDDELDEKFKSLSRDVRYQWRKRGKDLVVAAGTSENLKKHLDQTAKTYKKLGAV